MGRGIGARVSVALPLAFIFFGFFFFLRGWQARRAVFPLVALSLIASRFGRR